ncbi:MAG: nitroreductase family protein [Cytophagaceae bacterium]|nr:nitroreductase family protein [Cytophagaceae bacterium]
MTSPTLLNGYPFVSYHPETYPPDEVRQRAVTFYTDLDQRRSVRDFSDQPVLRYVVETLIRTASTAPSGANKQPWTFCAVSDPGLKRQIRLEAELEEYTNYHGRMSDEWLAALRPLATDWRKPFLETAPWLLVVFAQATGPQKQKHYYVNESVGLACGLLLAAIHQAGLVALTHTPSPMNFLKNLLNRPGPERPFLLIPIGYPAAECLVPDIQRKTLDEVAVFFEATV